MPKSYKILGDGNYIDSTGIAHNKVALNTVITNLQNADISAVNNLTSTDTKNALAAAQGKILAEQIQDKACIMIYETDTNDVIKTKLQSGIEAVDTGSGIIKVKSMIFMQSRVDEQSWLPLMRASVDGSDYIFNFFGFADSKVMIEVIFLESDGSINITSFPSGVIVNTVYNNLNGGQYVNDALHADQGKVLNDKITALEARIAALEAGEIELATDPADTDEMNVWIQTS